LENGKPVCRNSSNLKEQTLTMKKYVLIAVLGLSTIAVTATMLNTGKKPAAKKEKKECTKVEKAECSKKAKTACFF
jgi:hypothetical protein